MKMASYSEPQKMASFLKDRCDKGMYGLSYWDKDMTCICIPWPTVPKMNETIPEAFDMFKEWAVLSFLKRGNTAGDASKEGYSTQKHRFRNALTRADGLKYRDDLTREGYRVYQLPPSEYTRHFSPYSNGSYDNPPLQSPNESFKFQPEVNQPNVVYNEQTISELLDDIEITPAYMDQDPTLTSSSSNWPVGGMKMPESMHLKLYYRGGLIMSQGVNNIYGCRLYYGNNIPDMSKLLDRNDLRVSTRYPNEYYFGPEKFLQIQMPNPENVARNIKQLRKTKEIVDNMNRGLILLLSHDEDPAYPNVYGIRLCQTRVFPYECNMANASQLKEEGLKRLERTHLFDAMQFQRQLNMWKNRQAPRPSVTLRFAIGQKPLENDELSSNNLVTLEVTVSSAEEILNQTEETCQSEPEHGVLISIGNSMDTEAERIGKHVLDAITLKSNPSLQTIPS